MQEAPGAHLFVHLNVIRFDHMLVTMTATVRIRSDDMKLLKRLAKQRGVSVVDALSMAVEALRKRQEYEEELAKMNAHAEWWNVEAEDVAGYAASW